MQNNHKIEIDNKVKNVILKLFNKKRIISLLFFGTNAFKNNTNSDSDYDFILVLDRYNSNDMIKLRRGIISTKLNKLKLDINFIYLKDLNTRGKNNFQLRSLLPDFYQYLENAQILYGKNIFKINPVKLENTKIKKMIDFKIQEHYGRCDKIFTKGYSNEETYKSVAKYTRDMIRYILIRNNFIKIEDMTKLTFIDYLSIVKKYKLFSISEIKHLSLLKNQYSKEKDLYLVDIIRRRVYDKYLQLYKSS